eukprot:11185038-Karenia_brevis.AAC.1
MEHPEVPFWDRAASCLFDVTRPDMCDHVVSSFTIDQIKYLAGLPGFCLFQLISAPWGNWARNQHAFSVCTSMYLRG